MTSHYDINEDASLALALRLQAEFDRTPSSQQGQQQLSVDDDYRLAAQLQQDYTATSTSNSLDNLSSWRVNVSDEEYARQLQAEVDMTITPPMSDEDFARLIQMQENGDLDHMYAPPSSMTDDNKTRQRPPSPPKTPPIAPPQHLSFSAAMGSSAWEPQPPPLFQRPSTPEGWIDQGTQIRNDPAIRGTLNLAHQLAGHNWDHQLSTVFLGRRRLILGR
jgi:hypothetical protein